MDQIDSQRERAQFEAVWKRVTESSENPYAIAGELHGPEPKQTQRAENYAATNHSDNRDETEYLANYLSEEARAAALYQLLAFRVKAVFRLSSAHGFRRKQNFFHESFKRAISF